MSQEPDLATIASLVAEPSRAQMLLALMGGEALPASELAYRAGITPQTASSHLSKLLKGGLIKVVKNGRHRYYSLSSHEVATTLETLQVIAPLQPSVTHRSSTISPELCYARTCYDHLAGQLGVMVTNALLDKGYIVQDEGNYTVTEVGQAWFSMIDIDVPALHKKRRKFAFTCLDWSERTFHIGGALGWAIADRFVESSWVRRRSENRSLIVTATGHQQLDKHLGIRLPTS